MVEKETKSKKETTEPKVPKWVHSWARNRARGLAKHLCPQILSDDELLGELIEDLVEDEDALNKLEEMGYQIQKVD